jgi:hypothetical protein
MQLKQETGDGAAVICDVPGQSQAWVHLIWHRNITAAKGSDAAWTLTFGYPVSGLNVISALSGHGIELPHGSHVISWIDEIYVSSHFPEQVSPVQLAELIEQIMVRLQGVTQKSDVEVALEMD